MGRLKLQKNRLTFRVATHANGVEDPPPSAGGAGEWRGGEILLAVVGTRLADELPGTDKALMPMDVGVHGWNGMHLNSDGNARPLSPSEAMYLLVGAAQTLRGHFSPDDARGQLCGSFVDAFYELVREVTGASPPAAPDPEEVH